ncbi:uncharacterized protein N7459_006992 [Penicillium hispanicum]|uniref:uncharacterized protein n=1 Tax=Penicillium hispanicum TaxID=1080232 RepID=UPI00254206FC|nr:uncharacterized protein N7459_006992 [Penicillium hispanicum]KAJ5578028.1 hypothetical protein N7459_006992 [Penicillium hispanicum]
MSQVSELVKDAKLPTELDSEHTTHTFLESTSAAGRRSRRREREEQWKRKRYLSIGTLGTVWLEESVSDDGNKLRAVKQVPKTGPGSETVDYNQKEVQHITLQLLEGLDFMHSNGFVHRDLKPQNVFVLSTGPDWWVKIGDFGIKKRAIGGLTGPPTFESTPAFVAPEVYERIREHSEAEQPSEVGFRPEADIWSLGVITYYLLTSKLPFLGRKDLLAYYKAQADLPLVSVTQSNSSPEVPDFLQKMLAAMPRDRSTARDGLEHAWLAALHQDSDLEEPSQTTSTTQDTSVPPSQLQSPQGSNDVMLPGTLNLTTEPKTPTSLDACLPLSPMSLGIDGDTYKQIVGSTHPASLISREPSTADSTSISQSQHGDSQNGDSERFTHNRQVSSSEMSPTDTLPPYTRRRSDAAPIPISDLTYRTPKSQSPSSSIRNSNDRFSEKIRRVSRDIVPKRSRRSQDHGKDKALDMSTSPAP